MYRTGHRGNPNWGKKPPLIAPPVPPTEFELKAQQLGLHTAQAVIESPALRRWAEKNANRRFVPEALLRAWGITVHISDTSL